MREALWRETQKKQKKNVWHMHVASCSLLEQVIYRARAWLKTSVLGEQLLEVLPAVGSRTGTRGESVSRLPADSLSGRDCQREQQVSALGD